MATYEDFLYLYFYQLEIDLNSGTGKKELSKIKFQSEEANTDEYVKIFFQNYIQQNCKLFPSLNVKNVLIDEDGVKRCASVTDLSKFTITKVYRPSELPHNLKRDIAESKHSVYTNPDLYIQISDGSGKHYYSSIELKTTKGDAIPGSSVQQVNPKECVIFVKHDDHSAEVSCGHYMNSITDRLPFPDRSPRPIIAFKTIKGWNRTNRVLNNGTLSYSYPLDSSRRKNDILLNWEMVLCQEWLETIYKPSRGSEKWFNNTIRMYTLELLKIIERNPAEKEKLKKILLDNIK